LLMEENTMKEATIHTEFGQIKITFQTHAELLEALKDIEQNISALQESTKRLLPIQPRSPKPGYENYYRFTLNGEIELIKVPEKQNEAVALLLFAFNPEPVTAVDIEKATGIAEVARRVLSQAAYKDLFQKTNDNRYCLTFVGIQMVQKRFSSEDTLNP